MNQLKYLNHCLLMQEMYTYDQVIRMYNTVQCPNVVFLLKIVR